MHPAFPSMSSRSVLTALFLTCCTYLSTAAEPAPADHKLRIVLVGDSTVAEKSGWGTAFIKQLAPDAEGINAARGGQSSKSLLDSRNWKKALDLKPDWVLIQFGYHHQ